MSPDLLEWLVGGAIVLVYAHQRFGTPQTNSSSTTRFKYQLAATLYLGAALVLFVVLASAVKDSPGILSKLGIAEDYESLATPLLSALLLTALLPSVPFLKEIDARLLSGNTRPSHNTKEIPMNRMTTSPPGRQRLGHGGWQFWPVLALMTLAQPALAETYTAVDCPGSNFTTARSINDRGDIVGGCDDANGSHGFLLRKGVYTLIDAPDATVTRASDINNRGDVVGVYLDDDEVGHGFLLRHGHFTTVDVPGSPRTVLLGIDERGRIVGFYLGTDEVLRGFLLDARGFQDIEFPDAPITGAWGINARTQIVGGYIDTNEVPHGFLLNKGTYSSIDFPGAEGSRAFGINILGHIVGGWSGDPECPDCFVNAFLLTRRGFTSLAFPHAFETVAWGINSKGQIVGDYFGEDEAFHGFLRKP